MPNPPQHHPLPRELDDLELLTSGALLPTTRFNEPGSPITLTLPGRTPNGVSCWAVITPSARHSSSTRAATSAAIGARSPSYGTAPIDSSSAISGWPDTLPAQNSWFFRTWLARRRTVHGGQLVGRSISDSSIRWITSTRLPSACSRSIR